MSLSKQYLHFLLISLGLIFTLSGQGNPQIDPELFTNLHYRHIGPIGNRVSAVVGEPGNPLVYYIGAASGGIFKSTDAGAHWTPIFDDQPAASIGALAIAPSDPKVVWAGTGETFIRSNVSIGNGIYKSTDGGKNWHHMGLENTGRIGRIIVHPSDPDIVYAAAMGHCYGPQPERGVFRSRDGGENWEKVLFVDENTGASDLIMDPNNPRILFAGTWQMLIRTWGRWSGGPGGGIHVSRDGGDTWQKLEGNGLPKPPWGKIGLAMSADNSDRVYALIETNVNREFEPLDQHQGVLWRSDDGGRTWGLVSGDHQLVQRPLYYTRMAVSPDDHNEVRFMSLRHTHSLDGGQTVSRVRSGGDHHDIWIDPEMPDRMILGHDQGISISLNRGESWFRPQLPVAQIYHAYADNRIPYYVYGNRQDGPSARGPSNTLTRGEIPVGAWHSVGGCESGFAIPDPVDSNIVWSGCYDGILERYDLRTGQARNVSVWPQAIESWPAKDLKYRFQWTFPVAISPHHHNRVYVGSQHIHVTEDGGQSYRVISPDLTTNDPEWQVKTGGLTPDDAGPTIAPVIFAIAESPLEQGVIWAGTNDGQVQVTKNGGDSWENVTAGMPSMPNRGTISNIEPSRFNAGTAYLSVDAHQMNDFNPHIYKTSDYGESWQKISGDIPASVFSYVHVVREDPVREGMLYAGTENSLYVSFNDGENWVPLQVDLPHAPVHWLTIQEHFNDLVVSTYGRGFWILDDITALQQLDAVILNKSAHLFKPRNAYRFRMKEPPMSQPGDPAAGENPEYGASLNFYLGSDADRVSLDIRDPSGAVVRSLDEIPSKKGLHQVYWDLRYEAAKSARLRTLPEEHAHVELGKEGWREMEEASSVAPLVVPGQYTVVLKVGDQEQSQPLSVLKDPNSGGSMEGIRQQMDVVMDLYSMVNISVDLINEIELIRSQLYVLNDRLKDREEAEDVIEASGQLDQKLKALEGEFFDLRLTGAGQDTLRWPRRLYAKISELTGFINQSDFPPTDQQMEVYRELKSDLNRHQQGMVELRTEVQAFNELLQDRQLAGILVSSQ